MGIKFWEVVIEVEGAVDYTESFGTFELAQENAKGKAEEYSAEVGCYFCAMPEASHGEDSHDYRPVSAICQIATMYDYGNGIEGSQYAGEEPITVWEYPEPKQEIEGQTSMDTGWNPTEYPNTRN